MKKILTLLTAIAFSGTILIAGNIGNSSRQVKSTTGDDANNSDVVIVVLADSVFDGEHHLIMYDSNNPGFKATDDLTTEVYLGTTVIWMPAENGKISEIIAIIPLNKKGKIMHKAAKPIADSRRFMHQVPLSAPLGTTEKYIVIYKDLKGKPHLVDPYLKIPDL